MAIPSAAPSSSSSSGSSVTSSSPRDTDTSLSSGTTPSITGEMVEVGLKRPISTRQVGLDDLFSTNVLAKILQVAERGLAVQSPLPTYPESVPQTGAEAGRYEHREADFWTCGFFPGSIYALLERAIKFPSHFSVPEWYREAAHHDLLRCGRHWSVALNGMSRRTDTHDMGFIIQPALQKDWEMTGNRESRESVINAAHALASRYDARVGAIRSWDQAINDRYRIVDQDHNFLVIIDSMCNLDLLYYVAHLTQDATLAAIATTHAHTVRTAILRDDFSSFHMVNFDPCKPGAIKARMTNQGWDDSSTWSRGQAWAILGFAQTYTWTRDKIFLDTAIACADMFLARLASAASASASASAAAAAAAAEHKHHHPFVPAWDFDALQSDPTEPLLRDTSAGVIAANGLLLIHQAVQTLSGAERDAIVVGGGAAAAAAAAAVEQKVSGDYLDAALRIVSETLDMSLDRDFAGLAPRTPPSLPLSYSSRTGMDRRQQQQQQQQQQQKEDEEEEEEEEKELDEGENRLQAHIITSGFDAILRNATANNNQHAHKRYWDHGLVYADYYLLEFGNKLCRMGLC